MKRRVGNPGRKAERIRRLLAAGCSLQTIANTVGCSKDYIRATRQRTGKDGKPLTSKAQRRYCAANNEAVRERQRAYMRRYREARI